MKLLLLALHAVIYHWAHCQDLPDQGVSGEGLSYIKGDVQVEEGHYFDNPDYCLENEPSDQEETDYTTGDDYITGDDYTTGEETGSSSQEEKVKQLEELKTQLMKLVDWGWLRYSRVVDRIVKGELDHLLKHTMPETDTDLSEADTDLSEAEEDTGYPDEEGEYFPDEEFLVEENGCDFSEEIQAEYDLCTVYDLTDDVLRELKSTDYQTYNVIKQTILHSTECVVSQDTDSNFSYDMAEMWNICNSDELIDELMQCLKTTDYTTYHNIKTIVLAQRAREEGEFSEIEEGEFSEIEEGEFSEIEEGEFSEIEEGEFSGNIFSEDPYDEQDTEEKRGLATTYSDNLAQFYSGGYHGHHKASLAMAHSVDDENLAMLYTASLPQEYKANLAQQYKANLAMEYKANLAMQYKPLAMAKQYDITKSPAKPHRPYSSITQPYCSLVRPRVCSANIQSCRPETRLECTAETDRCYAGILYKGRAAETYPGAVRKAYAGKTHKAYPTRTQKNYSTKSNNYYPAPVHITIPEADLAYPTGYFYTRWVGAIPLPEIKISDQLGPADDEVIITDEEYEIIPEDDDEEGSLADDADEWVQQRDDENEWDYGYGEEQYGEERW